MTITDKLYNGKQVKAVVGGVTMYYVGAHYHVENGQVTKYYGVYPAPSGAGAQRVAMRKNETVYYLFSDHLVSTSLTTDANGAKVSEMRYKPWGEVRYTWTASLSTTPAYKLPQYTFTGQFSYMDDPSTSGVTEGFGLMFYNARWYDPVNGRFAQADSIVPGGVQGLDRYAYTSNNPVRYTDPTGHGVDCGIGDPDCRAGKVDPKIQLFEYNHWLISQVKNKKMTDLEAFSYLVERAASLTPNCTECFVNNLGAILTGHSSGHPARNELGAQLNRVERDILYRTGRDYQLDQSGFDPIFQDPQVSAGGNPQPHHYWFYVQVGFESGGTIGDAGVLLHETILTRNPAGNSTQDLYLGYEGVDLGVKLAAGTINISEVGDYIRRTLSPGSENAEKWRFINSVSQVDVSIETAP